ncbi:Storkhead-box protein 1 [Holothuria leucospilota]|uniref:Storkhead-box protein 1 n=1 Tax=Holothuria leucospilota TaxID=206669 RepID=A0A9Q0YGV2_HOLLE|nr:Storkhead-box protein 1 [Holothuria leucospilota]
MTNLNVGDVPSIELTPVQQAQFIPLTEVLCLIVSEMNRRKLNATQESIRVKLSECYAKMPVPSPEIIHKSLSYLMHEGKVEYNGSGYHILCMDEIESVMTTDVEDVSVVTAATKPRKNVEDPKKDEKVYLMYKDGVLTKHTLPETLLDQSDQASRPTSYPANQTLGSIPESRTAFQRSQSMRERRSSNGTRSNFERANSMRVSSMDAYDPGYITSDNEAKQSCLGRLLSKSYQKKPARSSPKAEIHTFSGQFPPSDVNDPFFSYAHWAEKDKSGKVLEEDNKMEEKRKGKSKDSSPSKQRKSLPKDSNKYGNGQHRLDHGKLTMTAVSLQQKYQDMNQESMPESESEFLRPTQMYDNRFRTKAVAQQSQVCKTVNPKKLPKEAKDSKEDKIKHFFSSMETSRPVNPKPFQGLTSDEEKELDHYPSKETSTKNAKTKEMKDRRQARVFADAKLSDLDADDLSAVSMPKDVKVLTKSGPYEQVVRRPGRAMPVNKSGEVSLKEPATQAAKQVTGSDKSKAATLEKSSSLNYKENNQLRLRTEAAINRRPKSFAADSSLRIRSKSPQNIRKSVHGEFYGDEEIDELMKDELKKEKVRKANHSVTCENGSIAEGDDQRQNEINRQLESQVKTSFFNRGRGSNNSSSQGYGSMGDSSSIGGSSHVSSGMPSMQAQHGIPPDNFKNGSALNNSDINRNSISSSTGMPASFGHQRVESLSSVPDSGFNSPRSSILHGNVSNGAPTRNQELEEPVAPVTKSTTSVIIRPVPRKSLADSTTTSREGNGQHSAVFGVYCKPQSSASDQSSGSEVTVKARVQGPLSNDEKSDSSDKASSHSSHSGLVSKGLSHGRNGRGALGVGQGGTNNYEVIGMI